MLSKKQRLYLKEMIGSLQQFLDTDGAVVKTIEAPKKVEQTDEFKGLRPASRDFIKAARIKFGFTVIPFIGNKELQDLAWQSRVTHLGTLLLSLQQRGLVEVTQEEKEGRKFIKSFKFVKL